MFRMIIERLEVTWRVQGNMGVKRIKLGFCSGTGRPVLTTDRPDSHLLANPRACIFGLGRFSLPRSTGLRDRSTGLPQIWIFVLLAQSQPLDLLILCFIRDFAHFEP